MSDIENEQNEQKPITPCICPNAGWCPLHKIKKTAHFHKLCQTRPDYFEMYQNCNGPGQEFTNCKDDSVVNPIKLEDPKELPKLPKQQKSLPENVDVKKSDDIKVPSLWEQAKSFAKASSAHVASGLSKVTTEEQKERLAICGSCEWFKERENRCGHCGCPLAKKTLWKTSDCPIGKWRKL